MRYFLVSFNIKNMASCGHIYFESVDFPSLLSITKEVSSKLNEYSEIVILNIFEFKNVIDFNSFKGF